MSETTKLGLGALAVALALGVLGDGLLRASPRGLNVGMWIGALVVATVCLARWRRVALAGGGRWLVAAVLFFAAAIAWRDSSTLGAFNSLALLVALGLAAARGKEGQIRVAGLLEYAGGLLAAAWSTTIGLLRVLPAIRWEEVPRGNLMGQSVAVGRGFAIALPLILLFGGLFAAADAAFEGLAGKLFRWDFEELMSHLLLIALWAWVAGGLLGQVFLRRPIGIPVANCPGFLSLGPIEIGVVLGTLNALFLAFVLVQLRYFFGGAELVETSATLTYAEYARRGFFELVTVAALVLPTLLLGDWMFRAQSEGQQRLFRALAAALVVLLFIIMASAFQRMRLYQQEFGLTEQRLYTTAFMGWLALVFLWFLVTVLRGQRDRFAFGALVTGFVALGLLNALNPDDFIVRTNVSRVQAAQPLDVQYLTALSSDAVPALVEALPAMSQDDRDQATARLHKRWSPPESFDWRTWNWGRIQAWWAVSGSGELLPKQQRK